MPTGRSIYVHALEARGVTASGGDRRGNRAPRPSVFRFPPHRLPFVFDSAIGPPRSAGPIASFFASLKKELVHNEDYATREIARASLFEYIEMLYNRKRKHSPLGDMSPNKYEDCQTE